MPGVPANLFRLFLAACLLTLPTAVAAAQDLPPEPDQIRKQQDRLGSTNVPMDSWVYPALERLGSMGLIPFQSVSIRPWTRQECRRQVAQAREILTGEHGHYYDVSDAIKLEAENLIPDLDRELDREPAGPGSGPQLTLESTYTRAGTIAGPALADGFHFGQTWINDFGRPLARGTSAEAGYAFHATYRRYFFFSRQELQKTPTLSGITPAQAAFFYSLDDAPFALPGITLGPPIPTAAATPAYVRQRPLELYAGLAFSGYSASFGKQQLFWGPTTLGPLSFSSNAEPTYNLRLVATRPHPFPLFPTLGTYRVDLVFGKLSGHQFPVRPYFNGQKFDFTFGRNLELSFTRWSILFGQGHPFTIGGIKNNFISSNSTGSTFGYGDRQDPGDRKSDFDFRLHVPGLRNLLTVYADAYSDDDVSPIDAPRRAAWVPGLYLARLPYLPHMDLRFEVASTEELSQDEGGTRFFINNQYRDGNTNKGFLLGNGAAGRDSRVYDARTSYWFSARSRAEAGFRQSIGGRMLPGGKTQTDLFLNATYGFTRQWSAQAFAQYERFLIPSYLPGPQKNGSGWLQLTWTPNLSLLKH